MCGISFFEQQIFYLVLCWYILTLYKPNTPTTATPKINSMVNKLYRLIPVGLFICLESLVQYDNFGIQLIYLLPATIIGLKAQKSLHAIWAQPYLLLIICLFAQALLIDQSPPQIGTFFSYSSYTSLKIIANIIVLWFMILSLKLKGSRQARQSLLTSRG